jgi:hypothetical protein
VAGARFDIAFSCLHTAEVQLVQPGQQPIESGEAFVRDLSTLQAELAECHTAQQAAQVIKTTGSAP